MTAAKSILIGAAWLWALTLASAQSAPEVIPAKDLPKTAECFECKSGEEPVLAGFRYQKQTFYFCNQTEVDAFLADPDKFLKPDDGPVKVPT